MSKYNLLYNYLKTRDSNVVTLKFEEIEEILGFVLPHSAYVHRAWWGNTTNSHPYSKSWQNAGYKAKEIDLSNGIATFVRM